jgi:hypothetical protein
VKRLRAPNAQSNAVHSNFKAKGIRRCFRTLLVRTELCLGLRLACITSQTRLLSGEEARLENTNRNATWRELDLIPISRKSSDSPPMTSFSHRMSAGLQVVQEECKGEVMKRHRNSFPTLILGTCRVRNSDQPQLVIMLSLPACRIQFPHESRQFGHGEMRNHDDTETLRVSLVVIPVFWTRSGRTMPPLPLSRKIWKNSPSAKCIGVTATFRTKEEFLRLADSCSANCWWSIEQRARAPRYRLKSQSRRHSDFAPIWPEEGAKHEFHSFHSTVPLHWRRKRLG